MVQGLSDELGQGIVTALSAFEWFGEGESDKIGCDRPASCKPFLFGSTALVSDDEWQSPLPAKQSIRGAFDKFRLVPSSLPTGAVALLITRTTSAKIYVFLSRVVLFLLAGRHRVVATQAAPLYSVGNSKCNEGTSTALSVAYDTKGPGSDPAFE